ncbi:GntR family transcriptional regulator [Croceicoccus estronivorus]|uniref:GntR family transcriptional regulator n=1 Tax=Croceicoccus estronivorus TaxID=1172626 RepID=UPI000831206E|nr:GntR family transcriptional regulator [Croceicoccus estronivorus]OCC25552.1 GntR family transcriptional regulator [Croceicoccus estronivorus]
MDVEDLRIDANPTLVREHALAKLRAAIATGLYPPGKRLVERELCEALGVSRTSVREALRQLQAEGLIEVGPRRNIIVARVSLEDARDIYDLRNLIETAAIRRLVERADPKTIKRLQAMQKTIARLARSGDIASLAEQAGSFYEEILDGSASRIIAETGKQLLKRVSYLRLASMSAPHRLEHGIAEWERIVSAIVAGDADAAASALEQHIANSRDTIVASIERQEQADQARQTVGAD